MDSKTFLKELSYLQQRIEALYEIIESQDEPEIPEPNLSRVYEGGLAYGIAYDDGCGEIELLDRTFTTIDSAESYIRCSEVLKNYLNERLFVVSLRPQKIVKVVR